MGRGKKKPILQEAIDATPERLRHAANESSDAWEYVDPSRIDSVQPIGLVRRFRATHLDRWYKRDRADKSLLSFRQYYAGDWYRSQYQRAAMRGPSVVASYGERTSGGEPSYGLPRTVGQLAARKLWREAREQFPKSIVGFMDRLLLHDELPKYAGRAYYRRIDEVAKALDVLADWLKLPRKECS